MPKLVVVFTAQIVEEYQNRDYVVTEVYGPFTEREAANFAYEYFYEIDPHWSMTLEIQLLR